MRICLKALMYVFFFKGVQSADPVSWLPCRFTDENITLTTKGTEMNPIYRQAVLQFGLKGDAPVNPGTVTFLVTPSKLNIRQFLVGVEVDELTCSLARHSTDGSHVRWPVKGEHEYNRWFTLHMNHSKNRFNILAFIRQSTDQPPTGQHDYKSWAVIRDNDILTATVVMLLQTKTPAVKSPLKSQAKLHCQFDIDHKAANVTVRWRKLGDRAFLFNYNSQTGSGVALKALAAGDATYTIPVTRVVSEGTYVCSVNMHPLEGSLAVKLQIEEPPRISLNVDSTQTLTQDETKRVVCLADGYYPLDVDMRWSHQGKTDVGSRVESAQYTGHLGNRDGTYRLSGYFDIRPKLGDSGRKFTCSVYHKTLSAPITKTFTLIVEEPGRWILVFNMICLMVVFVLMLRFCLRGKKYRVFYSQCTLCVGHERIY
uniref:Ig-like domain-containing protein n=1 Tax=Neogobius melanostomus TaxID=47308 RepID=A0A8C6U5X7_9GOBI